MPTEFELHRASKRGDDAKALIESPLLSDCFAALKAAYLSQLMETDVTQSAFRDKCWMAARVVDVVKDHLVKMVNDGAVAKSDLDELAQEGERRRRFGLV